MTSSEHGTRALARSRTTRTRCSKTRGAVPPGWAKRVRVLESRTRNLDPNTPEWGKDIVDVEDFTSVDWEF